MHYDRDSVPITPEQWGQLLTDASYRRVSRTTVMDAAKPETVWEVSTVWLGLDHSFGVGLPLIFETMVFAEGSASDELCERYSTWQEAADGHTSIVVNVAAELADPVVMDAEDTHHA